MFSISLKIPHIIFPFFFLKYQRLFVENFEHGSWYKLFMKAILQVAHILSDNMKDELTYYFMLRNNQQSSVVAKEYIQQRFMSLIAKDMVKCLTNNGRWLSVSKSMEKFSKKLYRLLTNFCGKQNGMKSNDFDFVLTSMNVSFSGKEVCTNIPALVAVLLLCYYEDRQFLKANSLELARKDWETRKATGVVQVTEVTDGGNTIQLAGNTERDLGNKWFHVENSFRTLLLNLPKKEGKRGADLEPGQGWMPSGGTGDDPFKFGKSTRVDWSKQSILFFLSHWKEGDGVTFDQFLHVIASGGFISQEEEAQWTNDHPNINLDEKGRWNQIQKIDATGLRIVSTRKFWMKIEKNHPLWGAEKKGASKLPPETMEATLGLDWTTIMNNLWQIIDGKKVMQSIIENKSATTATDANLQVSAVLSGPMVSRGRAGIDQLKSLVQDLGMKYHHALLHQALYEIAPNNTNISYTLKEHFGNHGLDKKASWASYGPHAKKTVEKEIVEKTATLKTRLSTAAGELSKKLKTDYHPDDIVGKSSLVYSFFIRVSFNSYIIFQNFFPKYQQS